MNIIIKISLLVLTIPLVWLGYIGLNAYIKYSNYKNEVNLINYNIKTLNDTIDPKVWIGSFNLNDTWEIRKIPIKESQLGIAYNSIKLKFPRVGDIVNIHMYKIPDFNWLNNNENVKNSYLAVLKRLISGYGDSLEIGVDNTGQKIARVLHSNKTVVVWQDDGSETFEYLPFGKQK